MFEIATLCRQFGPLRQFGTPESRVSALVFAPVPTTLKDNTLSKYREISDDYIDSG